MGRKRTTNRGAGTSRIKRRRLSSISPSKTPTPPPSPVPSPQPHSSPSVTNRQGGRSFRRASDARIRQACLRILIPSVDRSPVASPTTPPPSIATTGEEDSSSSSETVATPLVPSEANTSDYFNQTPLPTTSSQVSANPPPAPISKPIKKRGPRLKIYPSVTVALSRKILSGKTLDFSFFDREGFTFQALLAEYGLRDLLENESPVYSSLVVEFYSNLSWEIRGCYAIGKSVVKGIQIELTTKFLNQVLGIRAEGPLISFKDIEQGKFVNKIACLNTVFAPHDPPPNTDSINPILLNANNRLFLRVLSQCVFPRVGSFTHLNSVDLFVLAKVLDHEPVNIAQFILAHMFQSIKQSSRALPYGMLLTHVFHHLNIPIPKRPSLRSHDGQINKRTTQQMGITKTRHGTWINSHSSTAHEDESLSNTRIDQLFDLNSTLIGEIQRLKLDIEALKRDRNQ